MAARVTLLVAQRSAAVQCMGWHNVLHMLQDRMLKIMNSSARSFTPVSVLLQGHGHYILDSKPPHTMPHTASNLASTPLTNTLPMSMDTFFYTIYFRM